MTVTRWPDLRASLRIRRDGGWTRFEDEVEGKRPPEELMSDAVDLPGCVFRAKAGADSGGRRAPIPFHGEHPFRGWRAPIPDQAEHPFRGIRARARGLLNGE